jgi:hypothetical protein
MKKSLFKLASGEQAKGMTVEKMRQITEVAPKMLEMLQNSEVEAWVQDHVTTAHDDLMEVYGYMNQMHSEK